MVGKVGCRECRGCRGGRGRVCGMGWIGGAGLGRMNMYECAVVFFFDLIIMYWCLVRAV